MGRLGTQIPEGPFTLPTGPTDMINIVQRLYEAWYSLWADTLLIKLLMETQLSLNGSSLTETCKREILSILGIVKPQL